MKIRRKTRKTEVDDIDITSLLDILVILLVFLLRSFNDSDLTVDIANELAIPFSNSRVGASQGVILQVNAKKNLFINTEVIGNLNDENTVNVLKSKLLDLYKETKVQNPDNKEKQLLINLVFDKGLTYDLVNEIMVTAANSGFGKYKLIIQGEE